MASASADEGALSLLELGREKRFVTKLARLSEISNSALYISNSSKFCRRMSMMKAIFGWIKEFYERRGDGQTWARIYHDQLQRKDRQ